MLTQSFPNGALILSADKVRELESVASELDGIPSFSLMQRAGEAAFNVLQEHWPNAKRIAVVCGRGNNGGDGFVLAKLAHQAGFKVAVLLPDSGPSRGDAQKARAQCGIVENAFSDTALQGVDVIVDAMLGIGFKGTLREELKLAVRAINESGRPVLALDCPTGLQSDSGEVEGEAVRATVTLSFIAYKPGLLTKTACAYVGRLCVTDLSIPDSTAHSVAPDGEFLHCDDWRSALQARDVDSHKGHFGHVLVVGGALGMGGAARLTSEAALRAGAGLVSAYCHQSSLSAMLSARPEIMAQGFSDHPESTVLSPLVQRATVLAVGPGFSQASWVKPVLEALHQTAKPMVWDADALNVLAANAKPIPHSILTPHPKEAARLLGVSVQEVQKDRVAAARAILQKYQASAVVLKGWRSIVVDEHHFSMIAEGNPAMASGGMGDILTGIVAALWAQGLTPFDAARIGASLHAWAGDRAAEAVGSRGLLASDLLPFLPQGLSQ